MNCSNCKEDVKETIEKWFEKDLHEGIISSPLQTDKLADRITALIAKEYVRKEDVKEQTWYQDKHDEALRKEGKK